MDAQHADTQLSKVAAAIAEPARSRMLCCLLDGHARTSTELAVVAEVSPSTASVHLARLKEQRLIESVAQGRHRYYQIAGSNVAAALEALLVVAGVPRTPFTPTTPRRLHKARTCYDHMAGSLAVALHDYLMAQGWLAAGDAGDGAYETTDEGIDALQRLGLDVAVLRKQRRRFACPCLDWSERRPHVGGALGAALLQMMLQRGWVERELDSRALSVTRQGKRQLEAKFGVTD